MTDIEYDKHERDAPIRYGKQPPLGDHIMDVLEAITDPDAILFVTKAGGRGCLMRKNFRCWPIMPATIQALVKRGYLDQEISQRSKVANMGWIQYVVTYDGQQAVNQRGR